VFASAMVIAALIAIVVMPFVTRRDIHDWCTTQRGLIHDGLAVSHGVIHDDRRARRLNDNHSTRSVKDWRGQPKKEPNRQPCLGGACKSNNRNRCNQTEERYSFHVRSDEALATFFNWLQSTDISIPELVRIK
jgi:hypothetical protein